MTVLPLSTPVSLTTHPDALAPGSRLAEFELLGVLGAGGFGMVYQAFDHSLQRPVAIKEYIPAALAGRSPQGEVRVRDPVDQPAFAAGLQSFVAEARLLAQFDHPSLVKVFRYWEANQTAYMVMPLYRGMTLQAARSQMRCPPTEAWLRKVLWGVLGALKTLHHGSAVHRDVSPDNIFLQDIGPPVLLDLGAARHAIGGKTQDLTDAFKLSYAPLEQNASDPTLRQGPWTDLYALAAVVHGLLCNKPPLPATFRAVRDRLPSLARVARTVQEQFGQAYSPAFVQAIGQALAIAPQDRPQNVAALVQAMALETPNGMSRFDWRAELGTIWTPPGAVLTPQAATRAAQAPGLPQPDSALTAPRRAGARRRKPVAAEAPAAQASGASRWRIGAGMAAVVLGIAAALFLGRGGVPQPALQAKTATPAAAPVALAAAGTPAAVSPAAILPVATALPGGQASVPGAVTPSRVSRKTEPAAEAGAAPVPAPATLARAEQPVAAPFLPDPRDLCADSSFLTRASCLYRVCKQPALASSPVCVENNAKMQNSRQFEGF